MIAPFPGRERRGRHEHTGHVAGRGSVARRNTAAGSDGQRPREGHPVGDAERPAGADVDGSGAQRAGVPGHERAGFDHGLPCVRVVTGEHLGSEALLVKATLSKD